MTKYKIAIDRTYILAYVRVCIPGIAIGLNFPPEFRPWKQPWKVEIWTKLIFKIVLNIIAFHCINIENLKFHFIINVSLTFFFPYVLKNLNYEWTEFSTLTQSPETARIFNFRARILTVDFLRRPSPEKVSFGWELSVSRDSVGISGLGPDCELWYIHAT